MTMLTPKTQEALSHVQLFPGEEIQYAVQADGFFLGTNPMAKLMAKLSSFFTKITGGHIRMFLVLTNQRVLLIESTAACCGFTASRIVHTISTKAIVEASTARATTWCCFHTRMVSIESLTQKYLLVAKGMSDQELMEFITRMSVLIVQNAAR